jgi:rubrerythrin
MVVFSAHEIYGMAEQIERNGVRYYRAAAEQADARRAEVLERLAQMEEDHEKTFQQMRSKLDADAQMKYEGKAVTAEAQQYLRAMAEGKVFDLRSDPVESLTDGMSDQDVLRKAIELEKDSIIFYLGMKELVGSSSGKKKIQAIIEEEIRHIGMLSGMLDSKQAAGR